MRHNVRNLLLIAVTVAAIAPSAAIAGPAGGATCGKNYSQNSVNGDYCAPATGSTQAAAATTCGKDYSRNSVDGNYCVSSVSSPIVASPQASRTPSTTVAKSDSFSWGNAAVGAGAALLLIAAAAGLTAVVRRRQGSSAVGQQRSPATG